MTKPVFILGPGRSGTSSFARMLNQYEGVEAHHEFCNILVQDIAALWSMNRIGRSEMKDRLFAIYGAALEYSDADVFVDASHKLSWLVEPLSILFPHAKFLHINRDGRVVASEFFYKFHDDDENTIYEDRPIEKIQSWLAGDQTQPPPPDKRHRWKVPRPGQPFHEEFKSWNRFQRCAYHWYETNRATVESFNDVPVTKYTSVQLEQLIKDEQLLKTVIQWTGVHYDPSMFDYMQTPHHVVEPVNYGLTDEQNAQFYEIAGPMMEQMGYTSSEPFLVEYLTKA